MTQPYRVAAPSQKKGFAPRPSPTLLCLFTLSRTEAYLKKATHGRNRFNLRQLLLSWRSCVYCDIRANQGPVCRDAQTSRACTHDGALSRSVRALVPATIGQRHSRQKVNNIKVNVSAMPFWENDIMRGGVMDPEGERVVASPMSI